MSKMRLIVGLSALLAATAGWCGGVGELYKPGERAAWIFELGGKRIGVHVFEYVGTVEFEGAKAHRFKGRVEMDAVAGVPRQKYEGDLWLDDAGHPLRHLLQARLGESYSSVDLRVKDGKAYAEIKQGPSEQRMEVDLPQGAYLQANNFIGYFEIVFGLLSPGKEAAQTLQLLSSNTLRSLPYEFRWSREFTLDQEGATSTGEVFDDSLGRSCGSARRAGW